MSGSGLGLLYKETASFRVQWPNKFMKRIMGDIKGFVGNDLFVCMGIMAAREA